METHPPDLIDSLVADWLSERPKSRPQAMQVVGRIIRLGRRYEESVTHMVRPYGLSYSDFDVIATLRRSGGSYELTPTELSKNVLLTSGAMTACLGRLEEAGLISRTMGDGDRRRLLAKLTPKGFDLVEELIDRRFGLADRAVAVLSAEQFATLEHLIRQLD